MPFARRDMAGLALALLAALVAAGALTQPGYYDSHDGLLNVHRLHQMERCLADGQLPCRWVPDMGRGYGYPLFNYYPPLGTLASLAPRAWGAGILDAVKGSMGLAVCVAALGMFVFARRFLGPRAAAVGAVLYALAPYVAVDVYVRGALAELWGMALLPWVFWSGERVARQASNPSAIAGPGCALAWTLLLVAHPLTALMVALPYAAWLALWLWREAADRRPRALASLAAAHALAVALAAWFVVPSIAELEHVHAGTLTSLYPWARYENNFLAPTELLAVWPAWGYGPFRSEQGMALFLGPVQALVLAAAAVGLLRSARRGGLDDGGRAAALLAASALLAAAMSLGISRPLWNAVPVLAWLQFPWRFLTLATFGAAFAGAWGCAALPPRVGAAATAALCVAAVASSWVWFQPKAMHPVADGTLANRREVAKSVHGLFDFLPAGVDLERFRGALPPLAPPPASSTEARIRRASRSSDRIELEAVAPEGRPALVRLESYAFPGWQLEVDGAAAEAATVDDPVGRLHVRVPPGAHHVTARFDDTTVRRVSELLSVAAGVAWLAWAAWSLRLRIRLPAE